MTNDDTTEHYTAEHEGKVGTISTVEEARKAHHLATADPEKDGVMSGPEHEAKYGLERAEASAETIAAEEAATSGQIETADAPAAPETTAAPRASKS